MTATCATGKIRYPDEAAAKVALVSARTAAALRKQANRREARVYQCPHCDGWHLTSSTSGEKARTVRPSFVLEPPLVTFRRYAEADLNQNAGPADVRTLHGNPLLWYRALQQVKFDVQNHIAKDRRSLAALRPPQGVPIPAAYLAAKRDLDARSAKRLHFVRLVERRLDEVRSLLGPDPIRDRFTVGDVVAAFVEIVEMAERRDLRAIREKAGFHAERWSETSTKSQ